LEKPNVSAGQGGRTASRIVLGQSDDAPPLGYLPLVSVVVTTYTLDRLKDVKELINSLRAQTYPHIEVVFVGDGHPVLCQEVARYAQAIGIENMRVVFNKGEPGASAARNLGIQHARGYIIAFIDDDAVAAPDWVEQMVKTYTAYPDVIGVFGPAFPLWEDPSLSWLPEELHWLVSCSSWCEWKSPTRVQGHTWTSNASFKKEAFSGGTLFRTGLGPRRGEPGWSREIISEDIELSMRIQEKTGRDVVYNPAIRVWKKVSKERMAWWRMAACAYGIGLSRRTKQQFFRRMMGGKALLTEKRLLQHILYRLMPAILGRFFARPLIAWLQLWATLLVLFFVTLGYLSSPFNQRFRKG